MLPVLGAADHVDGRFPAFAPTEILYYFDEPRIFTMLDRYGELYLVYWFDEDDAQRTTRFVAVPTDPQIVFDLCNGNVDIRGALEQPRCLILDVSFDRQTLESRRLDYWKLPEDALPDAGVMLYAHLEPVLAIKAEGPTLEPGQVPGSVVFRSIESLQKAVRILAEFVTAGESSAGRPTAYVRQLYDLPTQRLAFSSFEVAFRPPSVPEQADVLKKVAGLLDKGFAWLESTGQADTLAPEDPRERLAILRALELLSPAAQGRVETLIVKGHSIRHSRKLTTSDRAQVRSALKKLERKPKVFDRTGFIREVDLDHGTFEVRDASGVISAATSQKFYYEEDLAANVLEQLQGNEVRVIGELKHPARWPTASVIVPTSGAWQTDDTPLSPDQIEFDYDDF